MDAPWPVAVVTGASSGIGRELARRLAAGGSDLVLVARREDRLRELAAELANAHGTTSEVLTADLTDRDALTAVEARVSDPERPVDLLVNNAGFGTYGRFVELDPDREIAQIELNIVALVRLTRAAMPPMVRRGSGGILNMSSTAGFQPLPYNSTYAATKSFVTAFSEAIHEEVRGSGVTVTAVCPGFVRTEFQDTAEIDASPLPDAVWMTPEQVAEAALAAITRGDAVTVPGLGYRMLTTMSRYLPRWVVRRTTGEIAKRL